MEKIDILQKQFNNKSIEEILKTLSIEYKDEIVFSTSYGVEDQIITHIIATHNLPIEIFTLDTGRLFYETYKTWENTLNKYKIKIKSYFPNAEAIQELETEKGVFSFYESMEDRKQCCYIRKVEPLKRALNGKKIWITGIRAEQSPEREYDSAFEWDEGNKLIKFHPLLNWNFQQVQAYIKTHRIPYNPLHDKAFVSIGCQPCTRAVLEGEDFRAGRWWWEDQSKKECGLHR